MTAPRAEPPHTGKRLFGASQKTTAIAIAVVEASDETEAAERLGLVLNRFRLGDFGEVSVVEVHGAAGVLPGVPIFLEAFFRAFPQELRMH